MDIVLDNVETYASKIDVNFQKDDKNNMMVFINLSLHNPQFTYRRALLLADWMLNLTYAYLGKCM